MFSTAISKVSPPQVHDELTCSHNFRGGGGEESEQDVNQGWVYCKGKGWIVGVDHKGEKKQEDKEIGGGVIHDMVGKKKFLV